MQVGLPPGYHQARVVCWAYEGVEVRCYWGRDRQL